MLKHLHVKGYRSLRNLRIPISETNVIVGANGTGKTNLYRALEILSRAAIGQLSLAFMDEGGFPSAFWAGKRTGENKNRLMIEVDFEDYIYRLECGLIQQFPKYTSFIKDPDVKLESISIRGDKTGKIILMERKSTSAWVRDHHGVIQEYPHSLNPSESILSQITEPHLFPEISVLRQRFLDWRFYHSFPSHPKAESRKLKSGIRTPVISQDGSNLATALQTIFEQGDKEYVENAVKGALNNAQLVIEKDIERAIFELTLRIPGLNRPMRVEEFSDGTMQYLSLLAALNSITPPSLMIINEPESNLHSALIPALADMISHASKRSQIWITTHSTMLSDLIVEKSRCKAYELYQDNGETKVKGLSHSLGKWIND